MRLLGPRRYRTSCGFSSCRLRLRCLDWRNCASGSSAEASRGQPGDQISNSVPLEILYSALVSLCRSMGGKRAEIAPLAGLWIYFAGIKTVLAGRKLADHRRLPLAFLLRAACALRMLRSWARRMAGVGFSLSGMLRRGLALKRSPVTRTAAEPSEPRILRAPAASGTNRLPSTCA